MPIISNFPSGGPGSDWWGVSIDENGDLILTYEGSTPPDVEIDENGDLIYTIDDGTEINLGHIGTGGGSAGVSSFNGRAGAVVPQNGDYTASMVGALPLSGGTMTGNLNMGGAHISGVGSITGSNEFGELLLYGDTEVILIAENSYFLTFSWEGLDFMGCGINLNNNPLQNVRTPSNSTDGVNKAYVDGLVGNINSLLDSINGEVV